MMAAYRPLISVPAGHQHGNASSASEECLRAEDITMEFSTGRRLFGSRTTQRILNGVSVTLPVSRIVGIVGESGSGKTTLAKILAGLLPPTGGQVYLNGISLYSLNGSGYAHARKAIRFIFQNVNAPLNPRIRIGGILEEPLKVHTNLMSHQRVQRMEEIAREVDLPLDLLDKYPRALSGGEKRRVGIARALMCRPLYMIADEPTASLDADLLVGFLELFRKLRDVEKIGILVVSHDIQIVKALCDEVLELKDGRF